MRGRERGEGERQRARAGRGGRERGTYNTLYMYYLYMYMYMYSTRQKVAYTVYRFSVFSSVFRVVPFYRFTVPFTVLPFRFAVLPFQVQTIGRAVIAGEYLEVLKLGRCSATILMVDTYAEPFGEPPIRASGPSQLCRCNWSLSTRTPKS